MSTSAIYKALDPEKHEIRVLKILQSLRDSEDLPLKCSIKHISLDTDRLSQYVAVSYCWGPQGRKGSIIIDDHEVSVPYSAVNALQKLKLDVGELIWIDAICINQQDEAEKGTQITCMAQIYSKAKEVRILFGELSSEIADDAVIAVETVFGQCWEATQGLTRLSQHLYGGSGLGFQYSDEPLPATCNWSALRSLYNLPWFGRLWVVQEAALAKHATCHFGQKAALEAEKVTLAARWMIHRRYSRFFPGGEHAGVENASNMYHPMGRPLHNTLRRFHRSNCSEPRDKVYGMLGLMRPEIAAMITPDYGKPLVETYAEAVRASIVEVESPLFLQFVAWLVQAPVTLSPHETGNFLYRLISWVWERPHRLEPAIPEVGVEPDWPSWVVRLNGIAESDFGSCHNILNFNQQPSLHNLLKFEIRDVGNPLILSLRGYILGKVVFASQMFTLANLRDSKRLAQILKLCVENTFGHSTDDLPYTFVSGSNNLNKTAEDDNALNTKYSHFIAWLASHNIQYWNFQRMLEIFGYKSTPTPSDPAKRYWDDMVSKARNRRFLALDGAIAMGPPGAQVGDSLCYLSGIQVPFVIRPTASSSWKLIGDAYSRKFMTDNELENVAVNNGGQVWLDLV